MKNDLLEKVFKVISVFVGFGVTCITTPYINQLFIQQRYAYFTGKVLTIFSSFGVGIVFGVLFYWIYVFTRGLVEKIKGQKK